MSPICEKHSPEYDSGCFRCKLVSIDFAPSAMPNRHIGAVQTNAIDKQRNKDLPAYKRLVQSGLQPPSTVGAAALETMATTNTEVNLGRVFGKLAPRVEQGAKDLKEAMVPYKKTGPDE